MLNQPPHSPRIGYRADIDGLRAIAVLAVVAFHYFPTWLPGGYVGVDVFFVISGYLVTSFIRSEVHDGRFSVARFYMRRVRRLLPALVLVLAVVTIGGAVLLAASELRHLGKHLLAAAAFASNVASLTEAGYFFPDAALKPLMHLWSLGIEEQFYLFWPLLLAPFVREPSAGRLAKVVVLAAALSLTLSALITPGHRVFSFFLLPTRLWELALGGALALRPLRGEGGGRWRLVVPVAGLALLACAVGWVGPSQRLPGVAAAVPVLGTALLIAASPANWLGRILSVRWLVYVGLISYPLYLWHWPLMSFARTIMAREPSIPAKLALAAASVILAAATYELLERPLRRRPATLPLVGGLCAALAAIGIVGAVFLVSGGLPQRFPGIERLRATSSVFRSTETDGAVPCRTGFVDLELCTIADPTRAPTVALLGDSHAEHLYPGLAETFGGPRDNLLLLARPSTVPLYGVVSNGGADTTTLDRAFDVVLANPGIHTIIVAAFWASYHEEHGVPLGSWVANHAITDPASRGEPDKPAIFRLGLRRTGERVRASGKRLIVFLDIPSLPFSREACLPRPWFPVRSRCPFSVAEDMAVADGYREAVAAAFRGAARVSVVDPRPFFCPAGSCSVVLDDTVLYRDDDHLTIAGSRKLLRAVLPPP